MSLCLLCSCLLQVPGQPDGEPVKYFNKRYETEPKTKTKESSHVREKPMVVILSDLSNYEIRAVALTSKLTIFTFDCRFSKVDIKHSNVHFKVIVES